MKNNITTETKNESRSAEDIMQDHAAAGNDPDDIMQFFITDGVPTDVATPVLMTVPVMKPPQANFIRTHHDESRWIEADILETKSGTKEELYLLSPVIRTQLAGLQEKSLRKLLLVQYTDRTGDNRLWPIKIGGDNEWNKTALAAAHDAKTEWLRVVADQEAGFYKTQKSLCNELEPVWARESYPEILNLAFRDRKITSMEHPEIQRLLTV